MLDSQYYYSRGAAAVEQLRFYPCEPLLVFPYAAPEKWAVQEGCGCAETLQAAHTSPHAHRCIPLNGDALIEVRRLHII